MSEYLEINQEVKRVNRVKHPWRRFFARSLDMAIYSIIITTFEALVLHVDTSGQPFVSILETFIAILIMLALEPLMLSTIGTTPGKWIFGLVIRKTDGRKITYGEGFQRTFVLLGKGLGFQLPIYTLYRQYVSYKDCSDGEELAWDEDLAYSIKDLSGLRILGYFAGWAVLIGLVMLITFRATMPTNRGPITNEEFVENCNDFVSFNKLDYGMKLSESGKWVEKSYSPSDYSFNFMASIMPDYQVIEENGQVKRVLLEIEEDTDKFFFNLEMHFLTAYVSFVGADKSLSHGDVYDKAILEQITRWKENYELELDGYRITNQVEYDGYTSTSSTLIPKDGEEQYLHLVFTVEKID
ncbi:RDD family protein [Acidaminobacter sp. JC074]|uniref:RDD family protein n=1 Tax=Acidaminobacter sp. JC074 TaxID=2530199 RepID=UPI001F0FCD68|nr:RDD family protein [Acidaminobacter sp. JC074]MCH4886232.1 RDD family protein [Acidaminobacter sp. JC074]